MTIDWMTTYEITLILGCLMVMLAVLRFFASIAHEEKPRIFLLYLAVGVGLLVYADSLSEDGLRISDFPDATLRLVASILR